MPLPDGSLTEAEMRVVLVAAGWPQLLLANALCISLQESGWNPNAINFNDSKWGHSYGLFQLNAWWTGAEPNYGSRPSESFPELLDISRVREPVYNAYYAYLIYLYGGPKRWENWFYAAIECQLITSRAANAHETPPAGTSPAASSIDAPPDLDGITGLPQGAQLYWTPADPSNYRDANAQSRRHLAIVIHTSEESTNSTPLAPAIAQESRNPELGQSTGYYIAASGDLYQLVRDGDVALAQATIVSEDPMINTTVMPRPPWWVDLYIDYDHVALSLSLQGYFSTISRTFLIDTRQWTTAVALCAFKCREYGIQPTREYILGHNDLSLSHGDPGVGFPWDAFLRAVEIAIEVMDDPSPATPLPRRDPRTGEFEDVAPDPTEDERLVGRALRLEIGAEGQVPLVITQEQRIKFKIVHSLESEPSPWTASLFNLRTESENQIFERGTTYRIFAGYGERVGLLCGGSIRAIDRKWEPPDRITKILLGADENTRQVTISQSWKDAFLYVVVDDIARQMGLTLGPITNLPALYFNVGDWAFAGRARDGLTDILSRYHLIWSEFCGALIIRSADTPTLPDFIPTQRFGADPRYEQIIYAPQDIIQQALLAEEAERALRNVRRLEAGILINEQTGMIGFPTLTETGVKVKTRLDGRLIPGRVADIQSSILSGEFEITEVSHQGDTWEGDWFTQIVAVTL